MHALPGARVAGLRRSTPTRSTSPASGEELDSPYVEGEVVDVAAWTRDALALALPAHILCRHACLGLCPECGIDLNNAGPEHHHEKAPDPRWAALSELKLDS